MLVEATRADPGPSTVVEASKPPRLNLAGVCLYCGERDCESAKCMAWHARSRWMVCPDCDGQEWSELYEPCGCIFGVVELWPRERVDAGRPVVVRTR